MNDVRLVAIDPDVSAAPDTLPRAGPSTHILRKPGVDLFGPLDRPGGGFVWKRAEPGERRR